MPLLKSDGPVLVAMSGGVDSSVAAAILSRRGFDVVGVTMQIWQESQTDPRHAGCCSLGAVEDARRVSRALGIPHYVVNFREEFRESVIEDFVHEYASGRTPNPCVECNRTVKFDLLLSKMRELGCARIATGHYARIRRDRASGRLRLLRARARDKDQSYVLYMLTQEQLAVSAFPMGELPSKAFARSLARKLGLPVAEKPESQDICFVADAGGYREFLRKTRPEVFREGEVVDEAGVVVGKHSGVAGFTVGQRRGLRVSSATGRPLYVLQVEPQTDRVVVGEEGGLFKKQVVFEDAHWGAIGPPDGPIRVEAKIRYNMAPQRATLVPGTAFPFKDAQSGSSVSANKDGSRKESALLEFDEPVRAVTPGQIAVAYRGQTVVAGGRIV